MCPTSSQVNQTLKTRHIYTTNFENKTMSTTTTERSGDCFDPRRSNSNPDALASFIRSPLVKNITSVPGVGEKNQKILKKDGISTTHQLIGKFLSLSEEDTDSVELCDKFYFWLQSIGVSAYRGSIVSAIAEKLNILAPNMYDSKAYNKL